MIYTTYLPWQVAVATAQNGLIGENKMYGTFPRPQNIICMLIPLSPNSKVVISTPAWHIAVTTNQKSPNCPKFPHCSNCQNPNLTTTQPNLNLVGFDMIIAVHTTPHHTTRKSTSTRNKGPSGLKFWMRPRLTKLATTQHNFNPTIFWGGGVIYPPPWINPVWFFLDKKK